MTNIEIYTKKTCPYCIRAKDLLDSKKQKYTEISIDNNQDLREEMIERSNKTTVPQIFINGKHIGGCDDLYDLESKGKLDDLLKD